MNGNLEFIEQQLSGYSDHDKWSGTLTFPPSILRRYSEAKLFNPMLSLDDLADQFYRQWLGRLRQALKGKNVPNLVVLSKKAKQANGRPHYQVTLAARELSKLSIEEWAEKWVSISGGGTFHYEERLESIRRRRQKGRIWTSDDTGQESLKVLAKGGHVNETPMSPNAYYQTHPEPKSKPAVIKKAGPWSISYLAGHEGELEVRKYILRS
jgi:hypothetical protein